MGKSLFRGFTNRHPGPDRLRVMEESQHSGTIGILTSEGGRFSRFWLAMLSAAVPPRVKVIVKMSLNIAEARNEILRDAEGAWVWFIDDDHTFPPDLLQNLLAREVDIVQPLVLGRYGPFGPVAMGAQTPDGKQHYRFALKADDPYGLRPVDIVGCGGMLVRRHVWEAMEPPYFAAGTLAADVVSEDISFCRRAKAMGFGVYVDMDHPMGHLNIGEVWPERLPDGSWRTKLIFGNETIYIPAAPPRMRVDPDTGEVLEHFDVD